MTVAVTGYNRVRNGRTEYVESHHRDDRTSSSFSNGKSKHATPQRTPEQKAQLRKKFGKNSNHNR
jgi:hypothetical protein